MSVHQGRYITAAGPVLAEGWTFHRLTRPSRLFGANGIRTGADGRLYVAQVTGSQVSAIDLGTGAIEVISAMGGDIVAPDDLVFDDVGNLYATEFTEGRVCQHTPDGKTRVVQGDMPCANPIAFHAGKLYAGECRPGGRIMELSLDGAAPRVIVDNVLMPNAMEVGPDGKLYYPVMGTNEIWRVDLAGGTPEKVAGDLGVPDAVKFDADGFIVSTQVASGQVLRIDPRTGDRTVLATVAPGLDNLTFVGRRLFVSSISGQINEILDDGTVRPLIPDGLNWPLGLAMNPDGLLYVADGPYAYTCSPGGELALAGMLFTPGFPGHVRGIAAGGAGTVIVTTANGQVSRWRPAQHEHQVLAEGFDRLYGVAVASEHEVAFAEGATGRVLAVSHGEVDTLVEGLLEPRGVAIGPDGACLVAESGAGRVVKLSAGRAETILEGLREPQGLAVHDGVLYVVDAGAKEVVAYHFARKSRRTIAGGLPIGAPPGVTPKFLRAVPPLSGPMGPFTGITAGPDGTLYVSGDAEGSLLAIRPH